MANIIYCSQTSQLWRGSTGFSAESTWTPTRNPRKDYLTQMFISSHFLCFLRFQYNRTTNVSQTFAFNVILNVILGDLPVGNKRVLVALRNACLINRIIFNSEASSNLLRGIEGAHSKVPLDNLYFNGYSTHSLCALCQNNDISSNHS